MSNICLTFFIVCDNIPTTRKIMKKIEDNLNKLMDYITCAVSEQGIVPSIREMCANIGVTSTSTINYYLNILEERGYIKRSFNKNRSIELTDKAKQNITPPNMKSVGLVGKVAAGIPIFAEENKIDNFMFSKNLFNFENMFMLKVQGDSMIDASILDGDFVVVKQSQDAENGQIVVAMVEDGATVKTFYKEKDCIRLQPENPLYQPIISPDIQILGVVVGLVRKF